MYNQVVEPGALAAAAARARCALARGYTALAAREDEGSVDSRGTMTPPPPRAEAQIQARLR